MAENSLIVNATDQAGNKLQRTMTCVSDTADRDKMLTFAQGINSLLTNNFVEAKRVQKVNLDDDPDGGWKPGGGGDTVIPYPEAASEPDASKTTPTITLAASSVQSTTIQNAASTAPYYYEVNINYTGDGIVYVDYCVPPKNETISLYFVPKVINDNGWKLRIYCDAYLNPTYSTISHPYTYTYTIRSTTTDNCNPASATFTVTVT